MQPLHFSLHLCVSSTNEFGFSSRRMLVVGRRWVGLAGRRTGGARDGAACPRGGRLLNISLTSPLSLAHGEEHGRRGIEEAGFGEEEARSCSHAPAPAPAGALSSCSCPTPWLPASMGPSPPPDGPIDFSDTERRQVPVSATRGGAAAMSVEFTSLLLLALDSSARNLHEGMEVKEPLGVRKHLSSISAWLSSVVFLAGTAIWILDPDERPGLPDTENSTAPKNK